MDMYLVCTLVWMVESENMVFSYDDPSASPHLSFLRNLFTVHIHYSTVYREQRDLSCKHKSRLN